ncbi:hypothetical protein CYY_000230 [Polysphondylium violaceum]|uniref:Uncharacterized protein n=1 Tax=Polysphondylium violaceum TaxID=133409 RepID=A0A8J4V2L6_9MYCE|nr:hypothetical protein CYY_000230 [Polysphondylium violaceum]
MSNDLFISIFRNCFLRSLIRNNVFRDTVIRVYSLDHLDENHRYLSVFSNDDKLKYNIFVRLEINTTDQLCQFVNSDNRYTVNDLEVNTSLTTQKLETKDDYFFLDLGILYQGIHRLSFSVQLARGIRGTLPDTIVELRIKNSRTMFYSAELESILSDLPNHLRVLEIPTSFQFFSSSGNSNVNIRSSGSLVNHNNNRGSNSNTDVTFKLPASIVDLVYTSRSGNLNRFQVPPNKTFESTSLSVENDQDLQWLHGKYWINKILLGLKVPCNQIPSHVTRINSLNNIVPDVLETLPLVLESLEGERLASSTDQPVSKVLKQYLPHLKHLYLSDWLEDKFDKDTFPDSLETLEIFLYSCGVDPGTLPPNLKTLHLFQTNKELETGSLPDSLANLTLSVYNQPLQPHVLPARLQHLNLCSFQLQLDPDVLPVSLTHLYLDSFSGSFQHVAPLNNLRKLIVYSLHQSMLDVLIHVPKIKIVFNSIDDNTSLHTNTSITDLCLKSLKWDVVPLPTDFLPRRLVRLELKYINIQCIDTIPPTCVNCYLRSLIRNNVLQDTVIPVYSLQHLDDDHQYLSVFSNDDKLKYNIFVRLEINTTDQLCQFANSDNRYTVNDLYLRESANLSTPELSLVCDFSFLYDGIHRLSFCLGANLNAVRARLPDSIKDLVITNSSRSMFSSVVLESILHNLPKQLQRLTIPSGFQFMPNLSGGDSTRDIRLPSLLAKLEYSSSSDNIDRLLVCQKRAFEDVVLRVDNAKDLLWLEGKYWVKSIKINRQIFHPIIPSHVRKLEVFGNNYDEINVLGVETLPLTIEYLHCDILSSNQNVPVSTVLQQYLPNLKHLFVREWLSRITANTFPANLESLGMFMYPTTWSMPAFRADGRLEPGHLPAQLQHLSMQAFNNTIEANALPVSLTHLDLSFFSGSFDCIDTLDHLTSLTVHILNQSMLNVLRNVKKMTITFSSIAGNTSFRKVPHVAIRNLCLKRNGITTPIPKEFLPPTLVKLELSNLDIQSINTIPPSCVIYAYAHRVLTYISTSNQTGLNSTLAIDCGMWEILGLVPMEREGVMDDYDEKVFSADVSKFITETDAKLDVILVAETQYPAIEFKCEIRKGEFRRMRTLVTDHDYIQLVMHAHLNPSKPYLDITHQSADQTKMHHSRGTFLESWMRNKQILAKNIKNKFGEIIKTHGCSCLSSNPTTTSTKNDGKKQKTNNVPHVIIDVDTIYDIQPTTSTKKDMPPVPIERNIETQRSENKESLYGVIQTLSHQVNILTSTVTHLQKKIETMGTSRDRALEIDLPPDNILSMHNNDSLLSSPTHSNWSHHSINNISKPITTTATTTTKKQRHYPPSEHLDLDVSSPSPINNPFIRDTFTSKQTSTTSSLTNPPSLPDSIRTPSVLLTLPRELTDMDSNKSHRDKGNTTPPSSTPIKKLKRDSYHQSEQSAIDKNMIQPCSIRLVRCRSHSKKLNWLKLIKKKLINSHPLFIQLEKKSGSHTRQTQL